jgi:anti-anti-sigma factor
MFGDCLKLGSTDSGQRVRCNDQGAHRSGNIGILETDGYINGAEAEPVAEAGEALIQEGAESLVINLEKSPIANSMGISILIELIEKVRERDGSVAFCCVVPILAKTFQIMGLLGRAEIYDTEEEALASLAP